MNPPDGWSPEQWSALPREEQLSIRFRFGDYAYTPEDPRIPSRQRFIHDLFAGKSHTELQAMLNQFIGPTVKENCRQANLRRLRRAAGIPITTTTPIEKVVSRVEEWAHKLLTSGQQLEQFIQRVKEATEAGGIPWDGPPVQVSMEHPLHDTLRAIVENNEHIGINALQRAAIATWPNDIGKEMLEEMRAKISNAGRNGGTGLPAPALLLGQYESYFSEANLRQLPAETLLRLSRSLGLTVATAGAIHRAAAKRFQEIRNSKKPCPCSSFITNSGPAEETPTAASAPATPLPAATTLPPFSEPLSEPIHTSPSPGLQSPLRLRVSAVSRNLWSQL